MLALLRQANIFVPSAAISPAGPTGQNVNVARTEIASKMQFFSHLRRRMTGNTSNTGKNENSALGNNTVILGNGTDTYTPSYLDETDGDQNEPTVLGNGTDTYTPSTPSYLDEEDGDHNEPIMLGNGTDTYTPSYLNEEDSDETPATTANATASNATVVDPKADTTSAQNQTDDSVKSPAVNETEVIDDESESYYPTVANETDVEGNVTGIFAPTMAPTMIFISDNSTTPDFEPINETDVVKNETDIFKNETVVTTPGPSPVPTAAPTVFVDHEEDRYGNPYESEKGSYGMESEVENGEFVDKRSSLNPVLLGVTLGILLCFSLCTIYVVKMNPDGLCATIVRCLGLVMWSVVSCPFKLCGLCTRKGRDGFDETGGYYSNNDRFVARDLELH
jgi:hypothetical protein